MWGLGGAVGEERTREETRMQGWKMSVAEGEAGEVGWLGFGVAG